MKNTENSPGKENSSQIQNTVAVAARRVMMTDNLPQDQRKLIIMLCLLKCLRLSSFCQHAWTSKTRTTTRQRKGRWQMEHVPAAVARTLMISADVGRILNPSTIDQIGTNQSQQQHDARICKNKMTPRMKVLLLLLENSLAKTLVNLNHNN